MVNKGIQIQYRAVLVFNEKREGGLTKTIHSYLEKSVYIGLSGFSINLN